MAARKYRESTEYRQQSRLYIDGNTVRREEVVRRRGGESKQAVGHRVKKNRERAQAWNLPYMVMLLAATIATLVICYMYLNLQSSITAHKHNISSLQSQVTELRTANDAKQENLKVYADLSVIYDIATTELGMVYPEENQVIEYDKSESEYVRQYDQIPTAD